MKRKLYDDAIMNFSEAQVMNSKIGLPVCVDIANCYRLKGDYQTALNHYDKVFLTNPQLLSESGIKRVICLVELQRLDEALQSIDSVY